MLCRIWPSMMIGLDLEVAASAATAWGRTTARRTGRETGRWERTAVPPKAALLGAWHCTPAKAPGIVVGLQGKKRIIVRMIKMRSDMKREDQNTHKAPDSIACRQS